MKQYKLIKKLPIENSPEIGYISSPSTGVLSGERHYNGIRYYPEKHPEYWEEVGERGYEILSFKSKGYTYKQIGSGIYRNEDGCCLVTPISQQDMISIESVKRLSDGEAFSIGDRVQYPPEFMDGEIKEIVLDDVFCDVLLKGCSNTFWNLNHLTKPNLPIFTTEDGFHIYKGDKYYYVNKDNLCYPSEGRAVDDGVCGKYEKHVYFSTKELAENYIIMNRRFLSAKEAIQNNPITIRGIARKRYNDERGTK